MPSKMTNDHLLAGEEGSDTTTIINPNMPK
jgi:hypothetical protein